MPGWRRNNRTGPPAAAPAVPPATRPRDDWRNLPPLPTVMRSPVTTVAVGNFSDSLGTWHNPSFLAPLGHQIDPDGPAWLITCLGGAPASREPVTYYRDRPLTVTEATPAPLQRSAIASTPPPPARSPLTTAPDVDLSPVPLPVVPAGAVPADAGEPEMRSMAPDVSAGQEPEPPTRPAEPPAVQPDTPRPPEQPLIAQRQITADPPPTPPRQRLGLGAPLTGRPGGDLARAAPRTEHPVVARSVGWPEPRDAAGSTPPRPEPSKQVNTPGSKPAQERPATASEQPPAASASWPARPAAPPEPSPAALPSVQRALAVQPSPDDPLSPDDPRPPRPVPVQAPLIGHQQQASAPIQPATHAVRPSAHPPAPTVAPLPSPLPSQPPLATTTPPLPSLSRPTAQRSVAAPDASSSYGPLSVRSPAQVPTPHPPGAAGPALTSRPPNPSPAEQPDGQQVPVQQDAPVPQRAPLLGYRLPPRILDARPGPQPQQATATLTATLGKLPVQRSVHVPPPLSRPGRHPPARPPDQPQPTGSRSPGTATRARSR